MRVQTSSWAHQMEDEYSVWFCHLVPLCNSLLAQGTVEIWQKEPSNFFFLSTPNEKWVQCLILPSCPSVQQSLGTRHSRGLAKRVSKKAVCHSVFQFVHSISSGAVADNKRWLCEMSASALPLLRLLQRRDDALTTWCPWQDKSGNQEHGLDLSRPARMWFCPVQSIHCHFNALGHVLQRLPLWRWDDKDWLD